MAKRIKLTDTISISELKHMREVEGLSNAEIAKRIGCAVSTVIDHIGKQPKEMTKRNQMAGMRRVKELPPLKETKTEIPDMPRESFKERCERLMAKTDENIATANKLYEEIKQKAAADIPVGEPKEADKAREAHCKEMETARAAGDKMAVFRKTWNPVDIPHDATLGEIAAAHFDKPAFDTRAHINELLAVFGPDVVRQYLRVALYALGIPDCRQVRREHLLDALNTLNKETTCND